MDPKINIVDTKTYYAKEFKYFGFRNDFCLQINEVEDLKNVVFFIFVNVYFKHEKEESYKEFLNHRKLNIDLYNSLRRVLFSDLLNDFFQESEVINIYDEWIECYTTYGRHSAIKNNHSYVEFKLEKKKHYYGYDRLTEDQFNWLWFIIYEYVSRDERNIKKNKV